MREVWSLPMDDDLRVAGSDWLLTVLMNRSKEEILLLLLLLW